MCAGLSCCPKVGQNSRYAQLVKEAQIVNGRERVSLWPSNSNCTPLTLAEGRFGYH